MEIGSLWKGWKVDKFIGEGSFGKVYRIIREEFGHTYESALKVIEIPQTQGEVETIRNEGLSDDSVTSYFQSMVEDIVDEFALMSKLKGNTNIVSYEDHFVVPLVERFGWRIYIRMELLTPLYTYMRENTFSIRDVMQLGIDMCQALEVCQRYNIIHRDIKPENIFVSDLGKFKLGDFGIARQLEKTSSGLSKKGTYTYMAPEVYKGMAYNSTVDIYSLGIVLYRFLNNNRTPFMPPYPQTIRYSDKEKANVLRISGQPIPKPCNAEGRLAEIILKACACNPAERYESASEMKRALQEILYSEHEAKLIYPDGDDLENKDFSSNISNTNIPIQNEVDRIEPVNDKTVSIFQSDKTSENEKTDYETAQLEVTESVYNDLSVNKVSNVDTLEENHGIADKIEESKPTAGIDENFEYEDNDSSEIDGSSVYETADHISTVENKTEYIYGNQRKEVNKKYLCIGATLLAILAIIIVVLVVSCGEGETENLPSANGTEQTESVKEIKKVKVPNVVGLTVTEAEDLLNSKSLDLEVSNKKYSNSVKKDSIISQSTKKDSMVDKSTTISVVVSLGVEKKTVPNVKGLSTEKAKKQIENSGLKCKIKYSYSDSVASGYVVKQSVGSGEKVDVNSTVTITISKGKKPSSNNNNSYYAENTTQAANPPTVATQPPKVTQAPETDDPYSDYEFIGEPEENYDDYVFLE